MGEVIYPGILLRRIDANLDEHQIKWFLEKYLGTEHTRDVDVTLYRVPEIMAMNVVIEGINMSFNDIRVKLSARMLGLYPVFQIEKYFGIPLEVTGLYKKGSLHMNLHRKLEEANGGLAAINIINRSFMLEMLGGMITISDVINFDGKLHEMNLSMLSEHLYYNTGYKVGNQARLMKHSFGLENFYEIKYSSRLAAMQDLCFLNSNTEFSPNGRRFFIRVTEKGPDNTIIAERRVPCEVNRVILLGSGPERVNVRGIVDTFGYMPVSYFNPNFFDLRLIEMLTSECCNCHSQYSVLGIDADMCWFAGHCECPAGARICFPGETFTRLTLQPKDLKFFNSFVDPIGNYHLSPVIEPLKPVFQSATHFGQVVLNVSLAEFTEESVKEMESHQTLGTLVGIIDLGQTFISNRLIIKTELHLSVTRSVFWHSTNNQHVKDIWIYPIGHEPVFRQLSSREMLNHDRFLCNVQRIRERDPNQCCLTVIIKLPFGQQPPAATYYHVVPCLGFMEFNRVQSSCTRWAKYSVSMPDDINISGTINDTMILESFQTQEHDYYETRLLVSAELNFMELPYNLDSYYIGICVFTKVSYNGRKYNLRLQGRMKYFKEFELYSSIIAIIRCPRNFSLQKGQVILRFWTQRKNRPRQIPVLQPYVQDNWEDTRNENDEIIGIDEIGELDLIAIREEKEFDPDLSTFHHVASYYHHNNLLVPTFFTFWAYERLIDVSQGEVYYRLREFQPYDIGSNEALITEWIEMPYFNTFESMNYYLTDETATKSITPTLVSPRTDTYFFSKQQEIMSTMNDRQAQAVEQMISRSIAVVSGPPGTGKSTVGARGVCAVACEEKGLIFVVTRSNKAADVIFEKIKSTINQFQLALQILRIYTKSMESYDVEPITDANVLHQAVQLHPLWNSSQRILEIRTKLYNFGFGSLDEEEYNFFRIIVSKIQEDILGRQDIVVVTVKALSDERMKRAIRKIHSAGSSIISIVLEEASMMDIPYSSVAVAVGAQRIALLGDVYQISPIAKSATAKLACLDVSWMEFFQLSPFNRKNRKLINTQLNVQYRMHPQISALVSTLTYRGELQDAPKVLSRPIKMETAMISNFFPQLSVNNRILLCYYNGDNDDVTDIGCTSFYNPKEACIAKDVLTKLYAAGFQKNQISILTVYAAQIAQVQKTLAENGVDFEGLDITTIDHSQGEENDVIILSLVRSNNHSSVGFLNDQRRLNVALSRAREFLFVICDKNFIQQSRIPFLMFFLNILQNLNAGEAYYYQI